MSLEKKQFQFKGKITQTDMPMEYMLVMDSLIRNIEPEYVQKYINRFDNSTTNKIFNNSQPYMYPGYLKKLLIADMAEGSNIKVLDIIDKHNPHDVVIYIKYNREKLSSRYSYKLEDVGTKRPDFADVVVAKTIKSLVRDYNIKTALDHAQTDTDIKWLLFADEANIQCSMQEYARIPFSEQEIDEGVDYFLRIGQSNDAKHLTYNMSAFAPNICVHKQRHAQAFYKVGDYYTALELNKYVLNFKYLDIDTKYSLNVSIGDCYEKLCKPRKARKYCRKASKIAPKYVLAWQKQYGLEVKYTFWPGCFKNLRKNKIIRKAKLNDVEVGATS